MTTPLPHGYPDWTRYRVAAARTYVDDTFTDVTVQPNFTDVLTTFVGDVPRISLFIRATTANFQVAFQFYDDNPATGGSLIHQIGFTVLATANWAHGIAVSGPWLRVLVAADAAVNEIAVRVTEAREPAFTQLGVTGTSNVLINLNDDVASFGSLTGTALLVWPGAAVWSLSMDPWVPVTMRLLYSLDGSVFDENLHREINPCEQSTWGIVFLPATNMVMNVQNRGNVTSNIRMSLSGLLAAPGI